MPVRRYVLDGSTRRYGSVVVGGSPLKLFRLTAAGQRVVEQIERDESVERSTLVRSLLDAGAVHPGNATGTARFDGGDVTVVVPAYGSHGHASPTAIVVDDGSEPPIPTATVRLDHNLGPAAARNAGLALVTTELVAFVDADVEVPTHWLRGLLSHFDDEQVAAVAPRVVSVPGTSALARYEMSDSPLDLGSGPARVRSGTRVSYVPAAAVVCRVDAIRAVGGFDETLRFGEDVDLVWRLHEAGWTVRYEPDVVVRHDPRSAWSAWVRQRIGYGSSAAPLAKRHPGALAPIRMSGWTLGAWLGGFIVHPAVGLAIAGGSSAALVRKLDGVPPRDAFLLAWQGNLRGGEQLAAAVRRVWWPVVASTAWRSRSARWMLIGSILAARRPVRVFDDVAYSIGVWLGVVREREVGPLVPEISSWPGRRPTPPPAADR